MSEEQVPAEKHEREHRDGFSSGGVVAILFILIAIAAGSYYIGTMSARDSVNTCQCKCEMPKCEKQECPPQVLVEGEFSVRPIRDTRFRCEAWCAGGGSPACKIMKQGESSLAPDNVTCEED